MRLPTPHPQGQAAIPRGSMGAPCASAALWGGETAAPRAGGKAKRSWQDCERAGTSLPAEQGEMVIYL